MSALADEIRRRLGPPPALPDPPPVSIVVPNRDGADLLRVLIPSLAQRTEYPRLELILVDNASSDDSLEFVRRVQAPFPISTLANRRNESFSDACNQGAELASGDLLLFLNNDVEAFEPGWLRELVACLLLTGAGAVSATLICPDREHRASFPHGYGIAHRGHEWREEDGVAVPVLHGWEADPLDERLGEDRESPALPAACMLVARHAFDEVDGFTHGFFYGAEDVDLCLKLRQAGWDVVCSGRSLAVHRPVSTRRRLPIEQAREMKRGNLRLLQERWGPRLRREYDLQRGAPVAHAPSYCLKAVDGDAGVAERIERLRDALRARRRRCLVLRGTGVEDPRGLECDIAVHLGDPAAYRPKPGQFNVLLSSDGRDPAGPGAEYGRYDLFVSSAAFDSPPFAARLAAACDAGARELARQKEYPKRSISEPQDSATRSRRSAS